MESGWIHFLSTGEPLISEDGGIGLMQITNRPGFDKERLKTDIAYNIDAGIQVLAENFKRTDLPRIGTNDRSMLEHWYFAVMAYNGTKPMNSPFTNADGKSNPKAYQEKVYKQISNGIVTPAITSIQMNSDDFTYDGSLTDNIKFDKLSFDMSGNATPSTELWTEGKVVSYTGKGVRSKPGTGKDSVVTVTTGDAFTILGGPVYDENPSSKNNFVWYPVKTIHNGKPFTGFIASPYIR